MTTIINVSIKNLQKIGYKNLEEWLQNPNHIYIGRNMNLYFKGAIKSKWYNPFSIREHGREKCLELYREYILNSQLINDIDELNGKILGCWCKPDKCHGDILIELLK